MKRVIIMGFLLLFCVGRARGTPACKAVAPGSPGGNGLSWSTPATLPASGSGSARNTIYYLADGTYSQGYVFSTADNSTWTTFRKATATDYGQTSACSNNISAGWNAATMGGSQAVFLAPFYIRSGHFLLDGSGLTRSADWTSGYGIKVDGSGAYATTYGVTIDSTISGPGGSIDSVTVQYVEIAGGCSGLGQCNAAQEDNFYDVVGGVGAVNTRTIFQYNYIHDSRDGMAVFGAGAAFTSQYNLLSGSVNNYLYHGVGMSCLGGDGSWTGTIAYNRFFDNIATYIVGTLNSNGNVSTVNLNIYGNLFAYRLGWGLHSPVGTSGLANGSIGCLNGQICNWLVFNNTFANFTVALSNGSTSIHTGIEFDNIPASGTITAWNNLSYNNYNFIVAQQGGGGATMANDYNSYVYNLGIYPGGETHGVVDTANTVPFVGNPTMDSTLTTYSYELSSNTGTIGTDTNAGINTTSSTPSLAANATDMFGITRNASGNLWSRGASQYALVSVIGLSPTLLNWLGTAVGAGQTVTVTNDGTTTLNFTSPIAATNFAQTNNCGSSLAPNATCTVTVCPIMTGVSSGSLVFTTNAASSPDTVTLAASGIVPGAATTAGGTAGIQ
jgi:hypothetical protein